MNEKERATEEVVKSMQKKIDQLMKELEEQKAKNLNNTNKDFTTETKEKPKEPVAEEYSYEDDFEEESIASSVGESEKKEPSFVEEVFSSPPPSVVANDNKYDDDTFEDASIVESVKCKWRKLLTWIILLKV